MSRSAHSHTPEATLAITGIGLVSPLGHDLEPAWQALRAGDTRPVRHEHRLGDEIWASFPLFRVEAFEPRALPFDAEARAYAASSALWDDADTMQLAAASLRALADAGLAYERESNRVGLVLTHENPGLDAHVNAILESFHAARGASDSDLSRRDVAEQLYAAHRDDVYNLQTFMPLHRVSRLLGVHGHALFVNNACASGLYALDAAASLLRAGRCSAVIVAGADHPTSYPKYRWFAEQGLAAADGVMRPFDRDRHGFVLGDGGAALVLERLEAVRERGAHTYAAYRSGGFNQEAWKVALPDPGSRHYETAIRAALDSASLQARDIDWLVAHGAATSVTDAYEARSLGAVFGLDFERPRLTAFKPYVGHNLGGSGVTETALLLLAMQHGELPPARGCEAPDAALHVRPLQRAAIETPRFTMKCAAGFGGFNAACIFERLE